jgi:hypothetical protein
MGGASFEATLELWGADLTSPSKARGVNRASRPGVDSCRASSPANPNHAPGCPEMGQGHGNSRAEDFIAKNSTKSASAALLSKFNGLQQGQHSSCITQANTTWALNEAIYVASEPG